MGTTAPDRSPDLHSILRRMRSALRLAPKTLLRRLLILSALTTLIIGIQQFGRTSQKLADPQGGHVNDFDRWMIMTPAFLHDRVDYVDDLLPTPPITLMAFAPFTRLSRPAAQFAWASVKLVLVCLVFALATGMVARTGIRLTTPALLLIVSGWWLAVVVDMQEGQTNFLALLPLIAGLALAQRESQWLDIAAGGLIGLGVAVKVTPVVFVAYFAWRRRWSVAFSAVLSVAVCWLLVPALVFGWDQNLKWLGQWTRIMILPYATRGEVFYSTSQSVGSFALRLLSHVPAFETHRDGGVQAHFMNLLDLPHTVVQQIARGLMVGVGLAGLWWMRKPLDTLRSRRYILEVAAVSAFMLWFSERTWVHHYISFVLMLSAAAMIVSDPEEPERSRQLVYLSGGIFFALTLFASEAGKIFGRDGIDWVKAYGVYLLGSIIMAVSVLRAGTAPHAEMSEIRADEIRPRA